MPIDPDKLYKEPETAEFLSCSTWTLQAHRKEGRGIPWTKFGRSVRYLGRDIQEYLASQRVDPATRKVKGKPAPAALQTPMTNVPPHLRGLRGFSR